MLASTHLGAIILCGGQSTRMGTPKAALRFGNETLLERVVQTVRTAIAGPIVVVAAAGQPLPPLPANVSIAVDAIAGNGPLQGLHAGLTALAGRCDAALVVGCDHPLLRPEFLRRVCDRLGTGDAAVPLLAGRLHPLTACYRVGPCLPAIETLLQNHRLRVTDLFALVNTRLIDETSLREIDPQLDSVRNVNTPEEYRAALRDAGFAETEGMPTP
jgi:molybdopterin-guanine dinucleotide biosynthesis protein A